MNRLNWPRSRRAFRARRLPRPWRAAASPWVAAPLHASEAGATAAPTTAPAVASVAALLTGHVLRDGEIVLLILKPSRWFIFFSSLRFAAVGLILMISAKLWYPHQLHWAIEAGLLLTVGRAAWAVLNWMGRLYLLTDMRILRLAGVFTTEIYDCPLRKVARTRLIPTFRERLWRLGSIEIIPTDDQRPCSTWQTIKRPDEVNDQIIRAVARAKHGGANGGGRW